MRPEEVGGMGLGGKMGGLERVGWKYGGIGEGWVERWGDWRGLGGNMGGLGRVGWKYGGIGEGWVEIWGDWGGLGRLRKQERDGGFEEIS